MKKTIRFEVLNYQHIGMGIHSCLWQPNSEWNVQMAGMTERLLLRVVSVTDGHALQCDQCNDKFDHPYFLFHTDKGRDLCTRCSWWMEVNVNKNILIESSPADAIRAASNGCFEWVYQCQTDNFDEWNW